MAWKDAARKLVEKMRACKNELVHQSILEAYADTLEAIIDSAPDHSLPEAGSGGGVMSPDGIVWTERGLSNRAAEILEKQRQAKAEAALAKVKEAENGIGQPMVYVEGGPLDATMVEISPDMPIGARMFVGGIVHQLGEDKKLRPVEEKPAETKSKIITEG